MMKKILFAIAILLSTLNHSCVKESNLAERDYPFPEISGIVTENKTVTLNAELLVSGTQKIVSYGFEWQNSESPNVFDSKIEFIGQPEKVFSYTIEGGLKQDTNYIVRPFIITEHNVILGPNEAFIGIKQNPPVITGFSPISASVGEEIIIEGTGFSLALNSNKVTFDNQTAKIIKTEHNRLFVTVPNLPEAHEYVLRVETAGQVCTAGANFNFLSPWKMLNPSYFSVENGALFVLEHKGYSIHPTAGKLLRFDPVKDETTEAGDLPLTNIIQPLAASNDSFASVLLSNELYLYTVSGGWESLGTYPYTRSLSDYMFLLNGEIYVGSKQLGALHKYIPLTGTWENKKALSANSPTYFSYYSYDNKGYMVIYNSYDGTPDLAIYEPATNEWRFNYYPFVVHGWFCNFFINGNMYTGLGAAKDYDETTAIATMYKLNLQSRQWEELPNAPKKMQVEKCLTIDGIGYLFIRNTPQVWKYEVK